VNIHNLTPHPLVVCDADGNACVTILPSGILPRCQQTDRKVGELELEGVTVDIVETVFGEISDLPEPEPRVFLVVSAVTAQAARGRSDLLIPSDPVRDSEGRVIGCRRFARLPAN
jgi:hypothetical protein